MAIDRSGKFWRGTAASDLDVLLAEYGDDGQPDRQVVHVACGECGGTVFRVELDDDEGCARRTCRACAASTFMLESEQYADDADLGDATCPCGTDSFEVAVGFAVSDDGEVRWVYVALRCVDDGVLGVYTDWKIDYAPTDGLFSAV